MNSSSKISSFLMILLILNSTHFNLLANGRPEPSSLIKDLEDEKRIMRGLIGSRPPRCERVRCHSCGHCEAVQVPTNPQTKIHATKSQIVNIHLDYIRGDDNSNYKPMSWKCKCGNSIFNP